MATRNAPKDQVLHKLMESLNYCNSHHMPVQPIFEDIVDKRISEATCVHDFKTRRKEMKSLFPVLLTQRFRGMVPSIPLPTDALCLASDEFLALWLGKWVAKFVKEWETLPSERVARQKGTVTDEALIAMVSSAEHAGSRDVAYEWAFHHNLFMSAENVGGALLEEYIASKVGAFGWIWCRGKVLTAIDFCNADCDHMFQVKNKTNTENSSGKGFRESRGAAVWCRMRAERRNGQIETYWPQLIELIRLGCSQPEDVPGDLMSEDDYLSFVRLVSSRNPQIITGDEG